MSVFEAEGITFEQMKANQEEIKRGMMEDCDIPPEAKVTFSVELFDETIDGKPVRIDPQEQF
jgi:hypothetical protein